MRGHRYDPINTERERQLRASKAPGDTFMCGGCNTSRTITGRRKVGKVWRCGHCVRGAA